MAQTIEFDCKYENAGKHCNGKVVYEPEELRILGYMTRIPDLKSKTPYASGRMENMRLKCDKGHWGNYKIVKFPCQQDECDLVVVGTGEVPPVYQEEKRRVINGKVKLTCDNQSPHTYVYKVLT